MLAEERFNPAVSTQPFTFALSDVGEMVFLPKLLERLRAQASHAGIRSVSMPPHQIAEGLEKGDIDLTRFTSEEAILKEYKLWRRVIEQVTSQEMPPDDEKQPLFIFKDPTEWTPVRMRRHSYPSCLVFAKTGELFFAAYGDLWHGEIERVERVLPAGQQRDRGDRGGQD